jgi:hypothetical protein
MPAPFSGRTVTQVAISAAAGTPQDVVAAPGAGLKIYVVNIVLLVDTANTIVKFTEGTGPTDITGAMELADNGGLVVGGSPDAPVLQTNTAGAKLSVSATVGAAKGWLRYFVAA